MDTAKGIWSAGGAGHIPSTDGAAARAGQPRHRATVCSLAYQSQRVGHVQEHGAGRPSRVQDQDLRQKLEDAGRSRTGQLMSSSLNIAKHVILARRKG